MRINRKPRLHIMDPSILMTRAGISSVQSINISRPMNHSNNFQRICPRALCHPRNLTSILINNYQNSLVPLKNLLAMNSLKGITGQLLKIDMMINLRLWQKH